MGSIAAVALRLLATSSAGPLWRDEAGSASTATVATLAELWSRQPLDSFPLLWQLVLRAWTTVLWDGGDVAIRTLGLAIGLAVVPALWWTSRALGVLPVASIAVAATPLLVVWSGVQNRAYGLGSVLLALLVGAVWRVVQRASAGRVACAALIGLLAVHTTYHLPLMLAAILAGAAVVGLARRDGRLVAIAVGIGVACAASLLLYAGVLERTRGYAKMVYGRVTPESILHGLRLALEPGGAVAVVALGAAVALSTWAAVAALRRRTASAPDERANDGAASARDDQPAADAADAVPFAADATDAVLFAAADADAVPFAADATDAVLFAATAGLAATAALGPFLLYLRFFVQPWYYASAVLVVAIALDVVLQRAVLPPRVRTGGAIAVVALLALLVVPAASAVAQRQSNLDLVAAYLEEHARPGDLIVVYPWHYGVSFDRYYDGEVPFMTVPDVAGHDFHRFDQLEELMRDPERIKPGFRRIHQTLQAGGGVWLVGAPADEVLPQFPVPAVPSDDDPPSWNDNRYSVLAGLQLRWVLQQSAPRAFPVPPLTERPVRDYENAPITLYALQPR